MLPEKGLVGPHAIFDPAILDTPPSTTRSSRSSNRASASGASKSSAAARLDHHVPLQSLDAVGWHGELAPVRLNVRDIRAADESSLPLAPSAHTTFLSDRFVVCTFVPRPFETDPAR
jgi:homogentisate 1,2-dioxygenase